MDDSMVICCKIWNRMIVKYIMRATELAKQELILEKEGILKMGKNQASKSPARKHRLRCAGKQHATSKLLHDSPSAPTQQFESPVTNLVGLLTNMTLKGASSSSDIS